MNTISAAVGLILELLKAWNQWQLISLGEAKARLAAKENTDESAKAITIKQTALDPNRIDQLLLPPDKRG